MKKIAILIILGAFIGIMVLVFFGPFGTRQVSISDVASREIIELVEHDKNKNISSVRVHVKGYIDGTAFFHRAYKGKDVYDFEVIGGDVDLVFDSDWYEDICVVIYHPVNVKEGHLNIEYRFGTF